MDDRLRYFSYDAEGNILRRREGTILEGGFTQDDAAVLQTQLYAYVSGQHIGSGKYNGELDVIGRLAAYDSSETGSSKITVQAGDTLRGIAQRVYGNANLWYVIAQANALQDDSELAAGATLTIPEVKVTANDASTFKPLRNRSPLNFVTSSTDWQFTSPRRRFASDRAQAHNSRNPSRPAMTYAILDNDELLRLALDAMNTGKDADAVVMLKTLVERDPRNAYAQYLLAAQHAQMGLMDRAEAGFRTAVDNGLELPVARFQLGQLLLVKGDSADAKATLAPLTTSDDLALAAYSRALMAAADENPQAAINQLNEGLALPQSIPALGEDMQRLLGSLQNLASQTEGEQKAVGNAPAAAMYLSNYGRQN